MQRYELIYKNTNKIFSICSYSKTTSKCIQRNTQLIVTILAITAYTFPHDFQRKSYTFPHDFLAKVDTFLHEFVQLSKGNVMP